MSHQTAGTIDPSEVHRFDALAQDWWDPNGKFRPLHKLAPARLSFIRDACTAHFGKDERNSRKPLEGLSIIDIGCGGGLITEPLSRLGATVSGIDPASQTIAAAKHHAQQQNMEINYRVATVEEMAAEPNKFDAVTCLEVVEHVPDVSAFLKKCADLVTQDGLFIGATINRTLKSYALAIVAAEYVLGWVPRGTHQWDRFVEPAEFTKYLSATGLQTTQLEGLVYNPLSDEWSRSADTDVNYMLAAKRVKS